MSSIKMEYVLLPIKLLILFFLGPAGHAPIKVNTIVFSVRKTSVPPNIQSKLTLKRK